MEITCNVCLFTSTNPMRASCGHIFCWPCLYRMLDSPPSIPGQAQPCPACPAIIPKDREVIDSVVPGARTPDLAIEDDITDCRTTACQLLDLPPSHDAHIMENGLDHMSKDKANSLDNFQGVEIHPHGVISRTWNLLSTRYGSAIDEYTDAIHRDLVDDWILAEVAPQP